MHYYAGLDVGLDVGLKSTFICVVDSEGNPYGREEVRSIVGAALRETAEY